MRGPGRALRAARLGRKLSKLPRPLPPNPQAAGMHHGAKGAAALLAGWKHNPNERKHIATNRRRK